uniref:Uncharacterized protein n=1 Tax=Amphimedon queenslandica TaxID=400682 RepID=A0A1X7VBS5_AMPQE
MPLLYQFITDEVFQCLLKKLHGPSTQTSITSISTAAISISFMKSNALRYVGGYVCLKAVITFAGTEDLDRVKKLILLTEENDTRTSSQWIDSVNRGGLLQITEDAFPFFMEMEAVIKAAFIGQHQQINKEILMSNILDHANVKSKWERIFGSVDFDASLSILKFIIHLYITIRWFAHASGIVELQEQCTKKL